jgi:hypothetical protein
VPGPGSYDSRLFAIQEKSVKIGSSRRQEIITKSSIEMPGPGNYDHGNTLGKGPKFTFSNKPMRKDMTISPGPGAYEGDHS